jgi:hypothetical protein
MSRRLTTILWVVAFSWGSSDDLMGQTTAVEGPTYGFGSGHRIETMKSEWRAFSDRFWLDYDRNNAWPGAFNQIDQATYRAWFQPCLDRGWEIELTLSEACFDQAGQLNNLGAAKVAQAVHRSPSDRRQLYVHATSSTVAEARVENVRKFLQVEYGKSANLVVSATENLPITGRGGYSEAVTRSFQTNMPKPVLNVTGVSGAIAGQQ